MSQNPYDQIYGQLNITISQQTTYEEAEKLAVHLGYIYNTFGIIVKDFINILGYKFQSQKPQKNYIKTKKNKSLVNKSSEIDRGINQGIQPMSNKQQLEVINKSTSLNKLIKQIQNYRQPGNKNLPLNQQVLRQKLLKLKQLKINSSNQEKQGDFTNEKKFHEEQVNLASRKIQIRKNKDTAVISISSEDEDEDKEKMLENSLPSHHPIKHKAQLLGQNQNNLVTDSNQFEKNNQNNNGRRKVRNIDKSSSEISGGNQSTDNKKRLHPLDPFSIIYDAPHKVSEKGQQFNQIQMMSQGKKQQKLQKRQVKLQKQGLEIQNQKFPQIPLQKGSQKFQQTNGIRKFDSTIFTQQGIQSYDNEQEKHQESKLLQINVRQNYLNQINILIQRQFQQNLRMNQEPDEEVSYKKLFQQNQHPGQNYTPNQNYQEVPKLAQQKDDFIISQNSQSFDQYQRVAFDNISQSQMDLNNFSNRDSGNFDGQTQNGQGQNQMIQPIKKLISNNKMFDQKDQDFNNSALNFKQKSFRGQTIRNVKKSQVVRVLEQLELSQQNQLDNEVDIQKNIGGTLGTYKANMNQHGHIQSNEASKQDPQISVNKLCPQKSNPPEVTQGFNFQRKTKTTQVIQLQQD